MSEHICKPCNYCTCSITSDEPDEDCAVHGNANHRETYRCIHCGRFLKQPSYADIEKEMLKEAKE